MRALRRLTVFKRAFTVDLSSAHTGDSLIRDSLVVIFGDFRARRLTPSATRHNPSVETTNCICERPLVFNLVMITMTIGSLCLKKVLFGGSIMSQIRASHNFVATRYFIVLQLAVGHWRSLFMLI